MENKDLGTLLLKILEEITEIKVIQGRQEVSLEDHIRRTELLEQHQEKMGVEMKPLLEKHNFTKTCFLYLGYFATVITIVVGFVKIIQFLMGSGFSL